ncbi:MAG: hypothetical protein H0U75_13630 [Legionella sp.]|nr:hypothetical protein [Legionella sp.]
MPSLIQLNQAIFYQALLKVAYRRAAQAMDGNPQSLGFDVRGRLIYDLIAAPEDLKEILQAIEGKPQNELTSVSDHLTKLKSLIGINISNPIRCNLDLDSNVGDPQIHNNITELLKRTPQSLFHDSPFRMSIIPLYEELLANTDHNHAAVTKRLSTLGLNTDKDKLQSALTQAYNQTKQLLQVEIDNIFFPQNATVKDINVILDACRATLHKVLKEKWFETFKENINKFPVADKRLIYSALSDDLFKATYKEIPAFTHDIFGSDFCNGLVTYITNSEERTAHSKHTWATRENPGASALRFINRNPLDMDGSVSARPGGQISARVPSIADTHADFELDTQRIVEVYKQFHLEFDNYSTGSEVKSEHKHEPQDNVQACDYNNAIVYNLLTSIAPYTTESLDQNQNESARRILKGAHLYNKDVTDGKYIWVQNIGVNRHTENLGGSSELNKEVTLMADIAMLYTLQQNTGFTQLQSTYQEILESYKAFLQFSPESNFHQSHLGKKAAEKIKKLKKSIDRGEHQRDSINNTLAGKATLALLKLFANNDHYNEKYGNLVQSLSIYVGQKTVSGCKSANERLEDVQKRPGILICFEGLKRLMPDSLNSVLVNFLNSPRSKADTLDLALAQLITETRQNGDENSFSTSDQAGPSKLQVIASGFARGLWNASKTLVGITTLPAIGLGISIIVMVILGVTFPPIDLALAISIGVLGLGATLTPFPKLWKAAKVFLGLGTVSSIGLAATMGVLGILGVGCPPIALALSIVVGVIGIGIIVSTVSAFGLNAKNTNFACSPAMINCINANASQMQSGEGSKIIRVLAKAELAALNDKPNPFARLSKLISPKSESKDEDHIATKVKFKDEVIFYSHPYFSASDEDEDENENYSFTDVNSDDDLGPESKMI